MINKQNLWFLTLFSLILILGIYYITIPNDILKEINIKSDKLKSNKTVKTKIEELDGKEELKAMRVSLEEERKEKVEGLKEQLTSETLSNQEKNNVYEQLKYLNELPGKEEAIEKKIKEKYDLDCFIKIDNTNFSTVCISDKHDSTLANNIMRLIQKDYQEKLNITIKFQKK